MFIVFNAIDPNNTKDEEQAGFKEPGDQPGIEKTFSRVLKDLFQCN